ncbi:MAG: hypothetical protein EPN82_09795 [Bacteroidetes bacterium]|nr:MAG: hypothetical protein EPN82_09795 [Bacteroidota bacterium]
MKKQKSYSYLDVMHAIGDAKRQKNISALKEILHLLNEAESTKKRGFDENDKATISILKEMIEKEIANKEI